MPTAVSTHLATQMQLVQEVYTKHHRGGLQADAGFTERAEVFWSTFLAGAMKGIILGLAGGTNETFVSSMLPSVSGKLLTTPD